MIYSANDLIKLIHDTKAVSIWNHRTGPVFWYAASVPGAFYVNTESVIGPAVAERLLKEISAILAATPEAAERAARVEKLIRAAYEEDLTYQRLIATMAAALKEHFPVSAYNLISGGERRDWLFSIPLAHVCGLRHLYLFKNGTSFCPQPIKPHEAALHVADLINNAASYFNAWLPALEKAQLRCHATLSLVSRGPGVKKLKDQGIDALSLNPIDLGFFEKSCANGLIDRDTLAELALYFQSPEEWARRYLLTGTALFGISQLDAKSFERLRGFFADDPWGLRPAHEAFFARIEKEIEERVLAAA